MRRISHNDLPGFRTIGEERGERTKRGTLVDDALLIICCAFLGALLCVYLWLGFIIKSGGPHGEGFFKRSFEIATGVGGALGGFCGLLCCIEEYRSSRRASEETKE